jgi:hypothetical protein
VEYVALFETVLKPPNSIWAYLFNRSDQTFVAIFEARNRVRIILVRDIAASQSSRNTDEFTLIGEIFRSELYVVVRSRKCLLHWKNAKSDG